MGRAKRAPFGKNLGKKHSSFVVRETPEASLVITRELRSLERLHFVPLSRRPERSLRSRSVNRDPSGLFEPLGSRMLVG